MQVARLGQPGSNRWPLSDAEAVASVLEVLAPGYRPVQLGECVLLCPASRRRSPPPPLPPPSDCCLPILTPSPCGCSIGELTPPVDGDSPGDSFRDHLPFRCA